MGKDMQFLVHSTWIFFFTATSFHAFKVWSANYILQDNTNFQLELTKILQM